MKRLSCFLILVTVCFVFAACGNKDFTIPEGYPSDLIPLENIVKEATKSESYENTYGKNFVIDFKSDLSPKEIYDKYTETIKQQNYKPNTFESDSGGYMIGGSTKDFMYTINIKSSSTSDAESEVSIVISAM